LSPCCEIPENLDVLAETVGTLDLQTRKKLFMLALPRCGLERPGWQRLLLGTVLVANVSRAASKSGQPPQCSQTQNQQEPSTSELQTKGGEKQSNIGLVHLCPSLWKMVGLCRVLASTSDPPAAFLTEGRRRGSNILGN